MTGKIEECPLAVRRRLRDFELVEGVDYACRAKNF